MNARHLAWIASTAIMTMTTCPGHAATRGASPVADADAFSPVVTNPYFPVASVRYKEYAGQQHDTDTGETITTRVAETVLPDTLEVAGVEVAVVEVKEYEDGELVELTRDYYAQHADGAVYYFGEAVDDYEDGQIVGHSGAWLAGAGENQPGLFMPSEPRVGQVFEQERAPGIAEDISTVLAVNQAVTTPAGSFRGCLKTEDVNPLDGATEHKYYCPGVGVVREESESSYLDLVHFESSPPATPVARS